MSQTAARRTLGTLASDFISARQRPPVPMQPTFNVSLAPRTLAPGTVKAAVAAEVFRKERRVSLLSGGMGNSRGARYRDRIRVRDCGRARAAELLDAPVS